MCGSAGVTSLHALLLEEIGKHCLFGFQPKAVGNPTFCSAYLPCTLAVPTEVMYSAPNGSCTNTSDKNKFKAWYDALAKYSDATRGQDGMLMSWKRFFVLEIPQDEALLYK